ncbi:MAG: gamma-glutamylcyclotransferase, partial [Pseudomonadota bacterium]
MQTTSVFLFGTLRYDPLLQFVAGGQVSVTPAVLTDARCERAEFGDWPVLVDAPGAQAEGLLIACDGDTLARLDRYEAVFGYRRHSVQVETDGVQIAAEVWRPDREDTGSGEPWALEAWVQAWGSLTIASAADIMRQLQSRAPAEVGQVAHIIRARADAVLRGRNWRRPGLVGRGFADGDVEVVDRQFPYERFFSVEEITARFRRFDGQDQREVLRAVFRTTDAATLLPYDPLRDRVL